MKNAMTRWPYVTVVLVLAVISGCKRSENEAGQASSAGPSPSEIAAAVEATTQGMQAMRFEDLSKTHVGRQCVVVTHSDNEDARLVPPPPPRGMIRRVGLTTTIHKAELCELSSESLKIRTAYPTSGNYKTIEISRDDIQSVYLSE